MDTERTRPTGRRTTPTTPDEQPIEQVKELLEERVPLSLIMDLTAPDGPPSAEILDAEGSPDEPWWANG